MTREPGFYDDVPTEDYHGDRDSLSVSGAKLLLKAPALYRWNLDHPRTSDTFDYGHAAHALILGVGAKVRVIEAPDWRTNAAKAERDAAREAGEIPLLEKDYARVQRMADALSGHTAAMRLLEKGRPEVSAYAIDPETGVMRRCRFDWLAESVLTDYKSTVSADPADWSGRYGTVRKFGYDLQAAWYLDLARALDHPAEAFAFIAQEKEPPYLVSVVYVDDDDLTEARARNRRALELFASCRDTDTWPGYLPDTTAARLDLIEREFTLEEIA